MRQPKILRKLGRFVGRPHHGGPPVFVNSMPKAGTNIIEELLVKLGYKRNRRRCITEHTLHKAKISPSPGHFYIGHLAQDDCIHNISFTTVYLRRNLWSCLKSYVNYMYIDTRHPVSGYLRASPTLATIENLFFCDSNPNARPLVDEYLLFDSVHLDRYDCVIDFELLVAMNSNLLLGLSEKLVVSEADLRGSLQDVLASESYTKNVGRIDIFSSLEADRLVELEARVIDRQQRAFRY